MRSEISIRWSETELDRIDLDEAQPMPHEAARAWLDEQFLALECEPLRATGKVLTADKLMAIAQAAGRQRFTQPEHRDWAHTFARAASAALAKPVVRLDLPSQTIGY